MVRESEADRFRNRPTPRRLTSREGRCAPILALALLAVALFSPQHATAQEDCFDNAFCLEGVRSDDGKVAIRIRSLLPGAMTMRLDLELENLSADRSLPIALTVPGTRTIQPLRLSIQDPTSRWGYRFDAKWIMGTLSPNHDGDHTYRLPFDRGSSRLLGQGYNGTTTHRDKYALDFNMPEGTRIRASRSGTVVETEDRFRIGGPDESLKTKANYVKVQHEDGTIGNYVHLEHRGVRVREGQTVRAGDVLGLSGNTGFTTGPHLHFEVYGISEDLERATIPVHFLTTGGRALLTEGTSYINPDTRGPTRAPRRSRGW